MTVPLSLFIPLNFLALLSAFAIAGGLYFFFLGFRLLARKRLLLSTPTSKIRSAAMGLVEVNGKAAGPYTMPAPITGRPCFLYHTTAWRQRNGDKQEWEKVADETLHIPFFIEDSTGQLLIEPFGSDLDLHRDFHEEYDQPFVSASSIPEGVSSFLARHGVAAGRRIRIEERSIKPESMLFAAGTLTDNPGIKPHPFMGTGVPDTIRNDDGNENLSVPPPSNLLEQVPAPQVIRLAAGASASGSRYMGQQAKIAAALTRAGITKPEAWSVAGVPYQNASVAVEANAPTTSHMGHAEPHSYEAPVYNAIVQADISQADTSPTVGSNAAPPVVLMKGTNDPTFVISFRSQKEFVSALAWKSAAMISGGAAITLLGFYMLLAQMALL